MIICLIFSYVGYPQVIARNSFTSRHLTAIASINITLYDIEDHYAYFTQPYYIASVNELATSYTPVVQVLVSMAVSDIVKIILLLRTIGWVL